MPLNVFCFRIPIIPLTDFSALKTNQRDPFAAAGAGPSLAIDQAHSDSIDATRDMERRTQDHFKNPTMIGLGASVFDCVGVSVRIAALIVTIRVHQARRRSSYTRFRSSLPTSIQDSAGFHAFTSAQDMRNGVSFTIND